jgi:hypothetical protein
MPLANYASDIQFQLASAVFDLTVFQFAASLLSPDHDSNPKLIIGKKIILFH